MLLRLLPWGSWQEWDCVRAALFSDSSLRIKTALDRIACWHGRGDIPIAVEITAELISIHHRDPVIMPHIASEVALSEELLRMMYAMAIMRLVNGVVDQSKRITLSVACRAEIASLPRTLVDIRHEAAHNELPRISLLRIASKQALQWLEHRYWKQQRKFLEDNEGQLRLKLWQYLSFYKKHSLFEEEYSKRPGYRRKNKQETKEIRRAEKDLFEELLELINLGVSDIVSILVYEGLMEQSSPLEKRKCFATVVGSEEQESYQEEPLEENSGDLCSATDIALKDTLCRLSMFMPQLVSELLMGITRRLLGFGPVNKGGPVGLHQEKEKQRVYVSKDQNGHGTISSMNELLPFDESSRLIAWLAWLLKNRCGGASKKQTEKAQTAKLIVGEVPMELLQELLSLCLKRKLEQQYISELVSLISSFIDEPLREKLTGLVKYRKPEENNSTKNFKVSENSENSSSYDKSLSHEVSDMDKLINKLELDLFAVKEQQRFLIDLGYQQRRKTELPTSDSQSSRKGELACTDRWRLADRWVPCAIGTLPSATYSSGVLPPWLQICDEILCGVGEKQVILPVNDTASEHSLNKDETIDMDAGEVRAFEYNQPHKKLKIMEVTPGETEPFDPKIHNKEGCHKFVPVAAEDGNGEDLSLKEFAKSIQGCVLNSGAYQPINLEQILALQKEIHIL